MQITNVRVYPRVRGTLRSHADVTFDNCLCVRIRGAYVLCMPYEKEKEVVFGISHFLPTIALCK
jgi:DNA-binding cell septation regulator SpoVG